MQGNPVGFASVAEKGTKNTVTADASGNFSIRSKQAAPTLVVTVIGYDSRDYLLVLGRADCARCGVP